MYPEIRTWAFKLIQDKLSVQMFMLRMRKQTFSVFVTDDHFHLSYSVKILLLKIFHMVGY